MGQRAVRRLASLCTLAGCCSSSAAFLASPRCLNRHHQGRAISSIHLDSSTRSLRRSVFEARRPLVGKRRCDMTHHHVSVSTATPSDVESRSMMGDESDRNCNSAGAYFDEQEVAAFESAVDEIVSKRNVVRDFRKNEGDLAVVKERLLDKRRILPRWSIAEFLPPKGAANTRSNGEEPYAKQRLQERRDAYLDATGLTAPQHKLATVLLAHLADHCAKNRWPEPLHVAWEKILEAGLTPLSRTLSTYLYVLSLEEEADASGRDVAAEVAMFHDALYEPTEKTITLLVKSLVGRGDAAGAEALLDGISDGPLGQLRHRTTSPILKLYCEKGEIDSALRLYHRMRTTSRVKMDGATYAEFIASVAENGYFRSDASCIVGAEDLGYSQPCGPGFLDALITEMAEDVLDISEESAKLLHNGFASGFKESGLYALSRSDSMEPITSLCRDDVLVAGRVAVDNDTAKCPATNTTLRLIVLEQSQRVHVHDTLLEMARQKSMEYTARLAARGRTTRDNAEKAELATKILKEFSEWLDAREGKPYTAIVDGANVAYFGWGKVNVHQLTYMVDALEKQGEHPLVVFPEKYTRRKFHLRQGMMQVLRDEELGLLEGLKEKDQMYVVPPMCLDDLYWMLASVSNQTASTAGQNIAVPKDNAEGRFPGLRPLVITNDKMRDHKMELLEERAFRRWCCSHIINYNFTEFIENQWEEREITFHEADVFSDEIQRNECPGTGATAWHLPVSEWEANERFCLRLPS